MYQLPLNVCVLWEIQASLGKGLQQFQFVVFSSSIVPVTVALGVPCGHAAASPAPVRLGFRSPDTIAWIHSCLPPYSSAAAGAAMVAPAPH